MLEADAMAVHTQSLDERSWICNRFCGWRQFVADWARHDVAQRILTVAGCRSGSSLQSRCPRANRCQLRRKDCAVVLNQPNCTYSTFPARWQTT